MTENVQTIKPRLNLIRGHGPQLGAVAVERIHFFGLCEDGRTLMVLVKLVDGRIVSFTFCPSEPATASLVGTLEAA